MNMVTQDDLGACRRQLRARALAPRSGGVRPVPTNTEEVVWLQRLCKASPAQLLTLHRQLTSRQRLQNGASARKSFGIAHAQVVGHGQDQKATVFPEPRFGRDDKSCSGSFGIKKNMRPERG